MAIMMGARAAPMDRAAGAAPDAVDRARAFRRARRHSLMVKMLRFALPIGAVSAAALYGLRLGDSWQLGPGRLKVGAVEVTADDLTMKNPTYFGLTKDGGRYEVRAKKAVLESERLWRANPRAARLIRCPGVERTTRSIAPHPLHPPPP